MPAVVGAQHAQQLNHHQNNNRHAFVAAGFAPGAVRDGKPRTPYLAGSDMSSDAWPDENVANKLPEIKIQAASNRLAEDAARREERRKALSEKIWQSRDSDTRWNKRRVKKDEVDEYVDRLFRGGMEWKESKRQRAAKLRAELDAPKGFRRYTLNEMGKLEEVIQEFDVLPREVCAGKLQCQYYEGVSWVKNAHLRNIERFMGPLDDEEKRLLRLNGEEVEAGGGAGSGGGDGAGEGDKMQRSRLTTDEKVQSYIEKAKAEYQAARDHRREFEKRDKEFHKQVREAEAKWAARCAELDARKVEARAKAQAEEEEWRRRRAELEAERVAEHRAARRQLEEQRRAYVAKIEALKTAREEEYAKRREELMEQDRKHRAEQEAREAARAENAKAWKVSEREREKRLAEERAKPIDTELARERREWEAKYAELRASEEKARAEEKIKSKQMMRETDEAYRAKLAEISARCDAEIAERRKATAEYEKKLKAEEKAREQARLENIARARAEDRERKKIQAEKLEAKRAEAAAKARADFAVNGAATDEQQHPKKVRKTR